EITTKPLRIRILAGAPVVDGVFIDGQGPFRFVLDTGAQSSMISTALAEKLGMKAVFRTVTVTQTGQVIRNAYKAQMVRIGETETSDELFVAASFDAVHKLDTAVQGTLGQSLLTKMDYLLDFRRKQFTIGANGVQGG